jgi:hypothetical protein
MALPDTARTDDGNHLEIGGYDVVDDLHERERYEDLLGGDV